MAFLARIARSSRWLVLVAGGWIESLNGSAYVFSSYSQAMKLSLGYEQRSLDTVGFFRTLGSSLGIGPALLYHAQVPPWAIVLLGLAHSSFGYFMTWLALSGRASVTLWQMCAFQFLASNAQTYLQTAALVTCVKMFPSRRGFVVGWLKGFLGLSGSILVLLFRLLCHSDEVCMPLMLACLLPLLSVGSMLALRTMPPVRDYGFDSSNFNVLSGILVALAVYLFGILVLESSVVLGRAAILLVCVVMGLILVSPIYVVFKAELLLEQNASHEGDSAAAADGLLAISSKSLESASQQLQPEELLIVGESAQLLLPEQQQQQQQQQGPCIGEDFTTLEALSSPDFWLLFLAVLCGGGTASAVDSNLAQLGYSLGYSSETINVCVSLFSICSCFGRIGSGLVSEHFLQAHGTSRLVFLMISMTVLALGAFVAAMAVPGALFIISILTGLCEGALWCLSIAIASELFGLSSFSSILNIVTFSCPIGAYVLSVLVVGSLYDMEASSSSGKLLCYGAHCFGTSFIVLSLSCLLGALASGVVAFRTRDFYQKKHTL